MTRSPIHSDTSLLAGLFAMIAIIDYQMGNLRSVQKALERLGIRRSLPAMRRKSPRPRKSCCRAWERLKTPLPRFAAAIWSSPFKDVIAADKPFLGICLGLQLLFDVSYEDGTHEGLGVLPGEVVRFEVPPELKVPHMGWNALSIRRRPPILEGLADGTHVYFVHSYYVKPRDPSVIATETDYGGPFCSMIWRDNLFATQFHPEKSQADGLRILRNFAELAAVPAGS